ncbi:DUF350 domain-containing protein [Bacillus alkalicellulosilyticus]|uniref:DUF350 domain-containing protein n=1 Tax=Alkalihalobacterium alkalicellulosilyticum TaxID=1912214 RepID=UPI0009989086|nr:DUF350 domain-containing protein [Bacillus alkalicellulosilyticus]
MEQLIENVYVQTVAYFSVAVLAIIVFLTIFELVTKYSNWVEIKKGNVAVAMATGGKIAGISIIFHFSITMNDSILVMLGWGVFGFILLLISYFMYEFLTPSFNVDEEIQKGNVAVGLISLILSIALSFVIGASIIAQ